jgi:hypothetical protein
MPTRETLIPRFEYSGGVSTGNPPNSDLKTRRIFICGPRVKLSQYEQSSQGRLNQTTRNVAGYRRLVLCERATETPAATWDLSHSTQSLQPLWAQLLRICEVHNAATGA